MDIYRHDTKKFADAGLQLRLPVDLVPPNQYSRLTNVIPIIEGRLSGRPALKYVCSLNNTTFNPSMGVHTAFRLNQASISTVPERLFGVDNSLVGLSLPNGTTPVYHGGTNWFDGNPFTRTSVQFPNDPAAWAVFGEHSSMVKYKPNAAGGTGYAVKLGIPAPQQSVQFNSLAAGAITGNDYDWRYTYYNATTGTESNPSPIMFNVADTEIKRPTVVTSPDTGFGGSSFFSTSIPNGINSATGKANSASETRESIKFGTWAAASWAYQSLQLIFTISYAPDVATPLSGCVYFSIYFSIDNGTTWRLVNDGTFVPTVALASPQSNVILDLPSNIDLSQLQVRAVIMGVGDTTVPAPITARRIRERGGNFDLTGLLTGGGGNYASTLSIRNMYTYGVKDTATAVTQNLAAQQAVLCVAPDPSGQATAIRLYRRGGSLPESWFMVDEYPIASLSAGACFPGYYQLIDNVPDDALGQEISFTNDAPVTSIYAENRPLPYIWGPFNGYLMGCGDPDRPGAVYWSNPGSSDCWGSPNWIEVSQPSEGLLGGCVYNTRNFAFSRERMYELIQGISNVTFQPFPTPCSRGAISPWAICAADNIYFVARDGVYATTGGQEVSLVENDIKPLFPTFDAPGQDVNGYEAVNLERIEDIKLEYRNAELWFLYIGATTGTKQSLVFDTIKKRWRAVSYPVTFPALGGLRTVYGEPVENQGTMLGGDSRADLYTFGGTGNDTGSLGASQSYLCSFRTGAFDQGIPLNTKEYGNVIFDLDPGGTAVTITPYINGEAAAESSLTVNGSGRQQVPLDLSDVIAYNVEFEVSFQQGVGASPILYQFDILWREEPVYTKHFEVRETSHELPGYQFIRDSYVALRSTADVVLTLVFDNTTTQTYTIPSTGGARKKVYLPLYPNKFKTVHYSFDSAQQFKLYQIDSQVNLRMWNVPFDYVVRKPFGADSTLTTAALQAQALKSGF